MHTTSQSRGRVLALSEAQGVLSRGARYILFVRQTEAVAQINFHPTILSSPYTSLDALHERKLADSAQKLTGVSARNTLIGMLNFDADTK
jgi:hypothetical protein